MNKKLTIYIPDSVFETALPLLDNHFPNRTQTPAVGVWKGNYEPVTKVEVLFPHTEAESVQQAQIRITNALIGAGEESVLCEIQDTAGILFNRVLPTKRES